VVQAATARSLRFTYPVETDRPLVEAAGIEPASRYSSTQTSTRVFGHLISPWAPRPTGFPRASPVDLAAIPSDGETHGQLAFVAVAPAPASGGTGKRS